MDISDRALLVSVKINLWEGHKKDAQATDEVCRSRRADGDALSVNKRLLGDSIKPVSSAAGAIRAVVNGLTLPWCDLKGTRILKGTAFPRFEEALIRPIDEFESAVAAFLLEYETENEKFRARMGDAHRDEDYPPPHEVRGRYGVQKRFFPMPSAGDFRTRMADDELELVRRSTEATTKEAVNEALIDVVRQLRRPVVNMAERLALMEVTAEGKRVNAFRDTLVTNVREITSIASCLNLTDDPRITELCAEMEFFLADAEPEDLRVDKALRDAVGAHATEIAAKADDIMRQMAGFC